MVEAESIVRRVNGGARFLSSMEELGLARVVAGWGPSLTRLEEIWGIARAVEGVDQERLVERLTGLFFTPAWGECLFEMRGEGTVDQAITQTLEKQGRDKQIFAEFSLAAVTGKQEFVGGLIGVCESEELAHLGGLYCLRQLMGLLGGIDLDAPTAFLLPTDRENVLELSLRPKGLTPAEFLSELADDLVRLKRSGDENLRRQSIVGYSWLLDLTKKKKKTVRALNWLGIGPMQGAEITTVDPNSFFLEGAENRDDWKKILLAATTAIPLAGVNAARFLQSGSLPRISVLEIEAKDFWK